MKRSAGQAVILKTSSGALRGSWSGTAAAFLGVPYAMPPAGERRFLPTARVPACGCTTARSPTAPGRYRRCTALTAELGVGVPDVRGADASALIAATAAIGPAHRFGPAIPGDLDTLRAAAPPRMP